VRAFLATTSPAPDPWTIDVATLRADVRRRALAVRGELAPVASIEDIEIGRVRARLYRPADVESDVLVWAHGGGWVHGDLDTAEAVARALATRAGCAVASVDYRLAPEHPFPAGLDDVWTATQWAARNFARVAVGGDSSGGNLAASTALRARDARLELAGQLLVYPVLDCTPDTDYKRAFARRYERFAGLRGMGANACRRLQHFWASYVPDPEQRRDPLAAPLHAKDLRSVAPAILITAEHDFLRGEAEQYAERLRRVCVPVEQHDYAGQIHGFFEMFAVMVDAHHAVGTSGDALRRAFDHVHPLTPEEQSCDH
jgi:acetyl esterase